MVIQWLTRFWCGLALFVMLASSSGAQTEIRPDDLSSLRQLYEAGKYADAVLLAQSALELAEKQFGPEHPNVARSLNNLAVLYNAQGLYGEAEPLHKRALAIVEKTLGPEHPYVATSLNSLAGTYQAQGRYAWPSPSKSARLPFVRRRSVPSIPTWPRR